MEFFTMPGIIDAAHELVDMGALNSPDAEHDHPDYCRGAIEFVCRTYFRGGDPGSGERENYLRAIARDITAP